MNIETVKSRIEELEKEGADLMEKHNAKVKECQRIQTEYQEQFNQNQVRFHQLNGAVQELKKLLNGEQPT